MIQDDELFKDKISQKRKKLKNLVLFYSGLKNNQKNEYLA